eukprot:CAMPEP_0168209662 /NCGR_PEP_ID=MMETSP0140_2-20121125/2746_1 /TAXON_ID=44445 /ORGANISM="Pseudo-nitzschia australis, Strain 10249 10 AB" /LENGTH=734 /DNA_ID=CAMNT_0008136191 /DNA_START=438 /DNA_END=2638 /DNA_ORIENTATION=-
MKSFATTTLLATVLVVAVSAKRTTLRGSRDVFAVSTQEELQLQGRRRHLEQGISCRLFMEEVMYNDGSSQEDWVCELPQEEFSKLGLQYIKIDRLDAVIPTKDVKSGESILIMSRAIVDTEDSKMYIPSNAIIEVHNQSVEDAVSKLTRNLAEKTGTLNTLVVRFVDRNGVAPNATIKKLENDFFDDDGCLKSQYEACSYGKLKIQPFSGTTQTGVTIEHGVVEVHIDLDVSTSTIDDLKQKGHLATGTTLGDLMFNNTYDLVAYVFPPGCVGTWIASAYTNGKFSFYNNEAGSGVAFQVHEVGHNLGLAHSGAGNEYNDTTGMMGTSYGNDDFFRCFNPAKSFQLGWYNDKVKTIDPFSTPDAVSEFTLNGVSDYEQNDDALIVLRLEQTALDPDYFIGYNRDSRMNQDTYEDKNMITIIRMDLSGEDKPKSEKVGSLYPNQTFKIENFNNERDVKIRFVSVSNGTSHIRDAAIQVIDIENAPNITPPEERECENHTFEVYTDRYPGDNKFVIVQGNGTGKIVGQSPVFVKNLTTYTTEVCLPYKQNYKFVLYDKHEDGICCGQGHGFYRAFDSQGNDLFHSNELNEEFDFKVEFFEVGENPDLGPPTISPLATPSKYPTRSPTGSPTGPPSKYTTSPPTGSPTAYPSPTGSPTRSPTASPTGSPTIFPTTRSPTRFPIAPSASPAITPSPSVMCNDTTKKRFKIKRKGKGKKKNCKWVKKKKKCNITFKDKP